MVIARIDPHRAFAFFLACFFLGLTCLSLERSLCETLEAESALIAKAYVQGKALLVNELNGTEDLDKPPLYYWLIAGFSLFFPNYELASRLPSLVAAALFIILFYKISIIAGQDGIFFPAFSAIFLFCPKVLWMSQMARMDLLFSVTCFLALFFFIQWAGLLDETPGSMDDAAHEAWCLCGFHVSAGAAVMIKGPLGAILVFSTVVLFAISERRFSLIRKLFLSPYFLLFLFVCLPWYAYVTLKTDFRFFHRFILEENLSRFTSLLPFGSFKDFNHSPPTRYLVYFLSGFFPWSLIMPLWIFHAVSKWKDKKPVYRFLFIYFIFVFLFFSVAQSKRSDYILPLYPAAAFLSADFLFNVKKDCSLSMCFIRAVTWLLPILCAIMAIIGLCCYLVQAQSLASRLFSHVNKDVLALFADVLKKEAFVFLFSFLLCLWVLWRKNGHGAREDATSYLSSLLLVGGLFILTVTSFTLPAVYRGKDARPFCRHVKEVVGRMPLFYGGFWDEECTFYLDRIVSRIDLDKAAWMMRNRQRRVFIILDRKRYGYFRAKGVKFPFEYHDKRLVLRCLILVSNLPENYHKY